jgi:N-acyl-phosphatidylethanolamine-hydrolysing phospholipase D
VDPPRGSFPRATPSIVAPRAGPDELTLTWVGQSTFLVQIGGLNVLTDPVWSERASPLPLLGPRRWMPPGIALDALPPVDVVLLSHDHYDHLDLPTVARLARLHPQASWLAPLGLGRRLARVGVRDAQELDWWDTTRVGPLTITAAPAQHMSGRGLRDRAATLWCSWAVRADEAARAVYFAGDTAYFPELRAIGTRLGPFDAALLPVGGYEPRWYMRYVHLSPEEAVRAFAELHGARNHGRRALMVAMHWGTFKLADEAMDEPPRRVRSAWAEAAPSGADLWVPAHGETRRVERHAGEEGRHHVRSR